MEPYNISCDKLFRLDGQTAIVTGGGTGIGHSIVKAFIVNGVKRVYIVGRRMEKLTSTCEEIKKLKEFDGEVIPVQGDVSSRDTVDRLVQYFKSKEQSIDILVNNAGIMSESREKDVPVIADDASEAEKLSHKLYYNNFDEWEDHFAINATGPYFLTAGLVPLLAKAAEKGHGRGNVINIASIAGLQITASNSAPYQASKAATLMASKVLANRLDGTKIRINSVSPGLMKSEMSQKLIDKNPALVQSVPVGHVAEADEIIGLILYLASTAGQYTHGGNHIIDGGRLLRIPSIY